MVDNINQYQNRLYMNPRNKHKDSISMKNNHSVLGKVQTLDYRY